MSRRVATGAWLPLMDFSIRKGISLSTLRRHIKAKKIEFRIESGRYLLFDDSAPEQTSSQNSGRPESAAARISKLEFDLKIAHEEIAELKTLIALYEETPPAHTAPTRALDL